MKVIIDSSTEVQQNARPKLVAGLSLLANLCCKALDANASMDPVRFNKNRKKNLPLF